MNRRDVIRQTALILGSALSGSTLASILDGCQSNQTKVIGNTSFALSKDQQLLLAEITEVIIPATSTPGAKAAQVAPTIELILKDCYKKEQQDHFVKGLADLDEESKKAFDKPFIKLPPDQKTAILRKFEQLAKEEISQQSDPKENATNPETNLAVNAPAGSEQTQAKEVDAETGVVAKNAKKNAPITPFFTLAKELTLLGYFSSEIGCTQALAYAPVPGRYEGVVKLKEGQKAWAT